MSNINTRSQHSTAVVTYQVFFGDNANGNIAGVCVCNTLPTKDDMLTRVHAAELPLLSFVTPRQEGGYDIRWCEPEGEVARCGHGSLAAARHLYQTGGSSTQHFSFYSQYGELLLLHASESYCCIRFPAATPLIAAPAKINQTLLSQGSDHCYWNGADDGYYIAHFNHPQGVENFSLNEAIINAVGDGALIIASHSDSAGDTIVFRYFVPSRGKEDSATGSAGPWLWAALAPPDKQFISARQLSRQGGLMSLSNGGEQLRVCGAVKALT
ncbi:MAG: PhzF family phenazine biosynthesis protein [Spongiibacteraceae bacterium]